MHRTNRILCGREKQAGFHRLYAHTGCCNSEPAGLAESTQRLSDETREKESGIDWFKIAGLRNVLIHDYLGIDIERVWNILEKDLHALKNAIEKML